MIKINLLPVRAAQKKERVRTQVSILLLSLIAVFLICGAEYYRMNAKINDKRDEISRVEGQIRGLQKKIGEVSKYKKLQADLKKKLEILEVLKEGRSGPVHLLDELNRALPEKAWLTSFSVNQGSIKITGTAVTEKAVASFMENLTASAYYGKVELGEISQRAKGGIKLMNFSLSCTATSPAKK